MPHNPIRPMGPRITKKAHHTMKNTTYTLIFLIAAITFYAAPLLMVAAAHWAGLGIGALIPLVVYPAMWEWTRGLLGPTKRKARP